MAIPPAHIATRIIRLRQEFPQRKQRVTEYPPARNASDYHGLALSARTIGQYWFAVGETTIARKWFAKALPYQRQTVFGHLEERQNENLSPGPDVCIYAYQLLH